MNIDTAFKHCDGTEAQTPGSQHFHKIKYQYLRFHVDCKRAYEKDAESHKTASDLFPIFYSKRHQKATQME